MDKINTYCGKYFSPITPTSDDIEIVDIAHALSFCVRGNGHLKSFFSVAQHSINCAKEARAREYSSIVQLALLLHDGSEAYIADIIRPVKKYITNYYEIEKRLQNVIYQKYCSTCLNDEEVRLVKLVDDDMLIWELDVLMSCEVSSKPKLFGNITFEERPFKDVEDEFLALFKQLQDEIKGLNV